MKRPVPAPPDPPAKQPRLLDDLRNPRLHPATVLREEGIDSLDMPFALYEELKNHPKIKGQWNASKRFRGSEAELMAGILGLNQLRIY
jgi:hypothetical protein